PRPDPPPRTPGSPGHRSDRRSSASGPARPASRTAPPPSVAAPDLLVIPSGDDLGLIAAAHEDTTLGDVAGDPHVGGVGGGHPLVRPVAGDAARAGNDRNRAVGTMWRPHRNPAIRLGTDGRRRRGHGEGI